jgi:hypothetical protein
MFIARTAAVSEDVFVWAVGLCDQQEVPEHYFLVQRAKRPTEQDACLYFEFDDQARGFYGGVRKMVLSRGRLDVSLEDHAARVHSLPLEIQIELSLEEADWGRLRMALIVIAAEQPPGWLET